METEQEKGKSEYAHDTFQAAEAAKEKREQEQYGDGDDAFTLPIDEMDGVSAKELLSLSQSKGYTFDDVILLPGFISFGVHDVDLSSRFTKGIELALPFASSPMDSVTEANMAIHCALLGGIGIIHRNMTIEEQCAEVSATKRYESGFIQDPICVKPSDTLKHLESIKKSNKIFGFPVTETGRSGSRLLGMVTSRDFDFLEETTGKTVGDIMTPAFSLITLPHSCSLQEANAKLRESKKGKLPVVDEKFNVVSMVSRKDLRKNQQWPNASKDSQTKQLLVGAAIGINDLENDKKRLHSLVEAQVDVIVLDSKNGDSTRQIEMCQYIKSTYPHIQVVGGNVATASQVHHLSQAGVDAIRVGMGVASVATGQLIKAVGRAQLSAIFHTSHVARQLGIPVIADGGIATSGAAIKALALGASTVMMGSALAGTEESPGDFFFQDGLRLKEYRGKSSGSKNPYTKTVDERSSQSTRPPYLAQGVTGAVVDRGSITKFIPYMMQSIKHGLQDVGCASLVELHEKLLSGELRFEVRSNAAQAEGGIHDLYSYVSR